MISNKELGRQIMHAVIGIITVVLIFFEILSPFSVFLLIIAGILMSIISKRAKLPIISHFLHCFERDKDMAKFPGKGVIFFFIGVLLVLQLFERDIALAAIMILAFGDSVSHIIGKQFGQLKNLFNGKSKKLFEGTVAGALAGCAGAVLFVPFAEAFVASFAAMIAEVIKIDFNDSTLDDNLVVPLVAGTIMFLMRMYF